VEQEADDTVQEADDTVQEADMKERGAADQLRLAEQLLAGLNHRLEPTARAGATEVYELFIKVAPGLFRPGGRLPARGSADLLSELVAGVTTTVGGLRQLRARRVLWGWVIVLVAGAIAVYTEYMLLVAGKAFGLPGDYLAAFMWGLGGGAVLDAVSAAINQVTSPVLSSGEAKPAATT